MKLSVIMPVYNEKRTILEIPERVLEVPVDIVLQQLRLIREEG